MKALNKLMLVALAIFSTAAGIHSLSAENVEKALNTAPTIKIVIRDNAPYFSPKRQNIKRGTTVVWDNQGPALIHTIFIRTASGDVHSGSIKPGQSFQYKFAEEDDAVVKTSCEVHPYMYGVLVIGNPPTSLIAAVEGEAKDPAAPALSVHVRDFPLPVKDSVPGILAVDSEDAIWFTMGGGGFANINYPPLDLIGKLTADGDVITYKLPTPASGPSGLTLGPDDTVYVTEFFGNKIARLNPRRRVMEEFPIPTEDAWPTGLALDNAGNLWFNETNGNKIGRLSLSGKIKEYPVPTVAARSTGLAIDGQGNVWIAERDGNKIGCLRTDEVFVEYSIPTPNSKPTGIIVDSKQSVWFSERDGNKIGTIVDGEIRESALPRAGSGPFALWPDRDHKVWFTEIFGGRIGVLNPATGIVNEYELSQSDAWPAGLAMDSAGSLWFSSQLGNRVSALVFNAPKSVANAAPASGPQSEHKLVAGADGKGNPHETEHIH